MAPRRELRGLAQGRILTGKTSLEGCCMFIRLDGRGDRLGTKAGMTSADQGEKSNEERLDSFHGGFYAGTSIRGFPFWLPVSG